MSELRVDNIVDMGGSGAPQLRKGASVTGISTITQAVVGNATINAGGINATGVVTSTSNKFVGDFASGNITAGVMTATSSVVASNITINSGGVNASGIVSATSYQGSGANLTGIGLSIAPIVYNPDVSDSQVTAATGIGLTFNQKVFAGTGNVTLSLTSVGSTLVENFGVGSSVTYNNDADPPNITITPSSDLSYDTKYAISYPSGAFIKNTGAGSSFVGTAYTFSTKKLQYELWAWGSNSDGNLAQNNDGGSYSSPVQIPGTTWGSIRGSDCGGASATNLARKLDGTLWAWGGNHNGNLGQNNTVKYSSPVQIPGTTWTADFGGTSSAVGAIKTDGTLWMWGANDAGQLGLNNETKYSSPTQLPGTTWSKINGDSEKMMGIKTDGTLWVWGKNEGGGLGLNDAEDTHRSSPTQIPGTSWSKTVPGWNDRLGGAIRTDGTLWLWGNNGGGTLGQNNVTHYSSPVQVPGTTWVDCDCSSLATIATKSDGTLWGWGRNEWGELGQNSTTYYSSPVQIPGTTWTKPTQIVNGQRMAFKTDGTMWTWGYNPEGELGQNNNTKYSSPTQVPGTGWVEGSWGRSDGFIALKQV